MQKRDSESFARVSTVLIAIATEIDRFKGINGGKGRVTADNKPTTDTVGDQETKPPADHVAEVAQSIGFTDAARRLRSAEAELIRGALGNPDQTAYRRDLDYDTEYHRKRSAIGRDIGSIPCMRDPARRCGRQSRCVFILRRTGRVFTCPWASYHYRLIDLCEKLSKPAAGSPWPFPAVAAKR